MYCLFLVISHGVGVVTVESNKNRLIRGALGFVSKLRLCVSGQ